MLNLLINFNIKLSLVFWYHSAVKIHEFNIKVISALYNAFGRHIYITQFGQDIYISHIAKNNNYIWGRKIRYWDVIIKYWVFSQYIKYFL